MADGGLLAERSSRRDTLAPAGKRSLGHSVDLKQDDGSCKTMRENAREWEDA